MANPKHVEVVRKGSKSIVAWRKENPRVRLDLTHANLRRALLVDVDLHEANLIGADLRGAVLKGADLSRANLTIANLGEANLSWANLHEANLEIANLENAVLFSANLRMANLHEADLFGADLRGAVLKGANLHEANFFGAYLVWADFTGADLTGAILGRTIIGDCDLSQCVDLKGVRHLAPSSIDVDTLMKSFRGAGNRLTQELETFFANAGVPKELLTALPKIFAEVKYCTCFIAYGEPDRTFAERLAEDLKAKGVSCWLYATDATPGERTWREIGQRRREAEKMIVICSAAALVRDGMLKEIEEQIDEEPDKIVPVSLDELWKAPGFLVMRTGRDLKPFLMDRNYADFSDQSRYEEAFERLLKGLERKDSMLKSKAVNT